MYVFHQVHEKYSLNDSIGYILSFDIANCTIYLRSIEFFVTLAIEVIIL